jgi:hypothetical protein
LKTVYPKVCPTWLKSAINDALPMASEYLIGKYGNIFAGVNVIFQPNACRSRYFANKSKPHKVFGNEPVATISCRSELLLYKKKSLGDYKENVMVGPKIQIACAIIHELTHHYQHVHNLPTGELETTANELEFLKLKFPDWYKLIMISPKPFGTMSVR